MNAKNPCSKVCTTRQYVLFRYVNCMVKVQRNKGNDKHGFQESSYLWREKRRGSKDPDNALFLYLDGEYLGLNFTVILYTMNTYKCSFASSQYFKKYFLRDGLKTKFLIPVSVLIMVLYVHGHWLFSILCKKER